MSGQKPTYNLKNTEMHWLLEEPIETRLATNTIELVSPFVIPTLSISKRDLRPTEDINLQTFLNQV